MRQRTFRRFLFRLPTIGACLLLASLSTSCHLGLHGFHRGHHNRGHHNRGHVTVVRKHNVRHHQRRAPRVARHRSR